LDVRKSNPTPRRLLASLQTCLWAVLALCLGNAWGMRTIDPLDSPKAERPVLSESAEDAGYYFNARWYDAERGAFIGRDPKELFYSPYQYANNGPMGYVDRDGNAPDPVSFFWGQALAWNNMIQTEMYLNDQGGSYWQVAGGGLMAYLTTTATSLAFAPGVSGGLLNTSLAFAKVGVISGTASSAMGQLALHGKNVSDWSGLTITEGGVKGGVAGLAIGANASFVYDLGGTVLAAGLAATGTEAGINWFTDKNPLGVPSFTPSLNGSKSVNLDVPQSGMAGRGFSTEITP
jgi:hypothetical protein